MTKIDEDHPEFVGKVLCSKGIGAGYINRADASKHKTEKVEVPEKPKEAAYRDWETDRKSTRLNSSHITRSRMPSSA